MDCVRGLDLYNRCFTSACLSSIMQMLEMVQLVKIGHRKRREPCILTLVEGIAAVQVHHTVSAASSPVHTKELRNSLNVCSFTPTKERFGHYINDLFNGYVCVGTETEMFRRSWEDRSVR